MNDEIEVPVFELRPNVSTQLKQAREAAGLSIKDIAAKTRVPIRHLENLETEDFATLPGLTYVLGFVRNYARALELDDVALVSQLREQLAGEDSLRRNYADANYAAADPTRIPPKTFAWGAVAVLAVLLIGFALFKAMGSGLFTGASSTDVELADTENPAPPKPVVTAPIGSAKGPVVVSATDDVWVRIYTADGKVLVEKVMVKGDSFTIPDDVDKPLLNSGRLQFLNVTVGGTAMPSLGPADIAVKDLDISAAALLAKADEGAKDDDSAPASTAAQTAAP